MDNSTESVEPIGTCQRETLTGRCNDYATVKVYFSEDETDSILYCPKHLKEMAENHYTFEGTK